MNAEERILRTLYIKIVLSGCAAFILGILAAYMSGNWKTLLLGILVLGGFLFTFFSARMDVKKGNIVSVYAQCCGQVKSARTKIKPSGRVTYRFITQTANEFGVFDEEEGNAVSLYIKADEGKFLEGELYCLLFRKNDSAVYNEKNLMTYGSVPSDILSFSVTDSDGEAPENKSSQNAKLIQFASNQEDSDEE